MLWWKSLWWPGPLEIRKALEVAQYILKKHILNIDLRMMKWIRFLQK